MTQLKPFDDLFAAQTATEQDWAGVLPFVNKVVRGYPDYTSNRWELFNKAEPSGHSLLTANGLNAGKNWAVLTVKK